MSHYLEHLLPWVEKPGRYLGGEVNAVRTPRIEARLSICLAFPDVYEVGMSHVGLAILYGILNRHPEVIAERCFAPWPDMEALMKKHGIALASLESQTPLRRFDLVGFSLQYELSYTNVLAMLELSGIPLRRTDRREGDPIICAGGPCVFNPTPMAAFIDVFAIGEGEEVIREMAGVCLQAKERSRSRRETLELLGEIEGLYCPDIHPAGMPIKKRVVRDLSTSYFPEAPPVPMIKTIHDRITIEIARGCTRGCRFCQAGMVWRPVRERTPDKVEQIAQDLVTATGYDEISLLALSAGDYRAISPLIATLIDRYYARRIALALPSLRVETLSTDLIQHIRKVRKTSFTLAPEAGTERLRHAINKDHTEGDLLATATRVFEAGWRAIKLYFMIGLPGETPEDIFGIANLIHRVMKHTKKGGQLTVSISTFVPKAHTPFQWERQIGMEETREKQELLKRELRHRRIELRWHDYRMSLLEGLFSRGDENMGQLVEVAYGLGCRFDGWADQFRFDLWEKAIEMTGIDVEHRLASRSHATTLPWDFVDCGLRKEFLIAEWERAQVGEMTPDCRLAGCMDCGVCDDLSVTILEASSLAGQISNPSPRGEPSDTEVRRYRLMFAKGGIMRFLSHREVATHVQRALARCEIPLLFTSGFHPHPRISFAYATPVGMESCGEYLDMHLTRSLRDVAELPAALNNFLPQGIEVIALWELTATAPSLTEDIASFTFSVQLPASWSEPSWEAMEQKAQEFLATTTCEIALVRGEQTGIKDVKPLVISLSLDGEQHEIVMTLAFNPQGMIRPTEVLAHILGIPLEIARTLRVRKEFTTFKYFTGTPAQP